MTACAVRSALRLALSGGSHTLSKMEYQHPTIDFLTTLNRPGLHARGAGGQGRHPLCVGRGSHHVPRPDVQGGGDGGGAAGGDGRGTCSLDERGREERG